MSDQSVQEREREFHNKTFSEATRRGLSGYYSIVRDSRAAFEKLVLENCGSKRVLEYGCGMGTYSYALAARGARVTGIDISDVAIASSSKRAADEGLSAEYVRMNAEELEFPNRSFDLVCGVAILHHLDLSKSLAGLARVLTPGGKAVFMEPLGHNPVINTYRRFTPAVRTPDEHPLHLGDLELATEHFGRVDVQYFNLSTLLAVPFRKTRFLNTLLDVLNGADRALFRLVPPARRLAWQVVITLQEPRRPNA